MDAGLKRELEAKVYAGERLSREDGTVLFASDDLAWLGRLAHHKRTEINGDRGWFHRNRVLDLANVEDAVGAAREVWGEQPADLHIVNAVRPGRSWPSYPALLRDLKAAQPGVGVQCFSAGDIVELERIGGRGVLDELIEAGLDTLTGDESGWEDWSRVHRRAHQSGIRTPASLHSGIDPLLRLRELQDETGGFTVFIPSGAASPAQSLKTFAVARLLLDNVPHIQGTPLALSFGADEIDGSAAEETEDLLHIISDAGFRPVERDIRYAVVREHPAPVPLADRRSEPQQVWA
jgi:aminodeoxyfutalosine synthase